MSIPDANTITTSNTPPAVASSLPAKSDARLDDGKQVSAMTPPLGHLRSPAAAPAMTAAVASAASPSNDMSPAHQPTESSRHSTPATSAAGSDHAQSLNPLSAELPAAKPVDDAGAAESPQPSTPPSQPQQEDQHPQSQHDEHPLSSVQPAYFYPTDGSASSSHDGIPVFEPTMQQFQDFYAFCQAIDSWGMQYGIVKVVPPAEWRDSLPDLRPSTSAESEDHADVSKVRIRNAIMQHFTPAGSGVWRQINTTRSAKIWNAKQWAEMCVSEDQKGPEMDRMKWKVDVEGVSNGGWGPKTIGAKDGASSSILEEDGVRTRSGKARPSAIPAAAAASGEPKANGKRKRADNDHNQPESAQPDERSTTPAPAPASPSSPERRSQRIGHATSTIKTPPLPVSRDTSPVKKKNWEAEATTHAEWCAFDYKNCWRKEALSMDQLASFNATSSASTSASTTAAVTTESNPSASNDQPAEQTGASTAPPTLPSPSDWTPEVCREIESEYWRNLNFGKPPMYGADLSGTLFDDRTKHWNVGKLDSVLTRLRLRRKLPGVNTPYLYWGMWRATFAWHVEDMDLYSINYIHFGAPKQWYAIRQSDRQRFESAMAGAFPSDARRCPHFMRHKSYLASPSFLASHGIRPLKLVHNAGEFVITYPFGYHSGFNMGYNCAESVNFALESWLDIGRKANYCHCDMSQNSVRIDVDALLEESKEMEELERKREVRRAKEEAIHAVEEEELEKRRIRNEKAKERRRLKKEAEEAAAAANPAIPLPFQGGANFYIDPKHTATSPCVFCPADVHTDLVATPAEIESTNSKLKAMSSRYAHRLCASFVPETWVGKQGKAEVVCGIEGIDKARFSLKCQICPNPTLQKLYPKIQCTRGKCPRSAHVSCALVEENGWFVDLCPSETADRLEGKKTSTANPAQQPDGHEDGDRLVVLCKTHNPLFREAEEARKAEELRERIYALPIPSMVKIKTSGGMFQALMVEIHEDQDEIVIEDEGRPSTVKFQQIILEDPIKQEQQTVAIPTVNDGDAVVAVNGGEEPSQPTKRRRKASEKASANAKAASEEAVEASTAVSDAAIVAMSSKKPRKSRAAAAAAAAAAEAGPLGGGHDQAAVLQALPSATKGVVTAHGQTKPKRQRQSKKKAEAIDGDVAAPLPPTQWPGHPTHLGAPQQYAQQPVHQPQQQQQAPVPHATPKRGPRATYAAQHPSASQPPFPPQYADHHPYPPHQPHPHPHYADSDKGPMYRGQPHPGDAGQYGSPYPPQQYAPGYGRSEYPAGVGSPNYAHPPPQQPQPRATNGSHAYGAVSPYPPYQQAHHPSYAPPHPSSESSSAGHQGGTGAPPSVLSSASSASAAHPSQYGYLSAPVGGYDRSPPLPTYGKPLSHSENAPGAGGYPDYRPPYHHAAPAGLHPGYGQYRGSYQGAAAPPPPPTGGGYGGYAYGYPNQASSQPASQQYDPQQARGHQQQQHQLQMSSTANGQYAYSAHGPPRQGHAYGHH